MVRNTASRGALSQRLSDWSRRRIANSDCRVAIILLARAI